MTLPLAFEFEVGEHTGSMEIAAINPVIPMATKPDFPPVLIAVSRPEAHVTVLHVLPN